MKRPIILLLPGGAYDHAFHDKAYVLFKSYVTAVKAAGGLPVLLVRPELAEEYAKVVDSMIITGAHPYNSVKGLPPRLKERNEWEFPIIHSFMKTKKPILGICHGHQVLNLALGGTLKHQFKRSEGVEHKDSAHFVEARDGSFVEKHLGKRFMVNSLHNTRIDTLAPELTATAVSPDGVIEAMEHKSYPLFGFQFHPEKMQGDFPYPPEGPCTQGLLEDFVRMCGEKK